MPKLKRKAAVVQDISAPSSVKPSENSYVPRRFALVYMQVYVPLVH
jgi:hypothetical protein